MIEATRSFQTILVANRGEIASRIARSARALGYRVVGVYSEADAAAPYLDAMDEAVAIGPAAAAASYLSIERLIDAARRTGAGAVHPGYGFLSESAAFAEACGAAGLVWVGPPPAVLRAMGDKAAAKEAMTAAGLRCVPGVDGRGLSDADLARAAGTLALPILVKAAAGGGGRGMRRVERAEDLAAALHDGRREAEAAFGCGDLLVETALDAVRHVEVQVLFDAHGHGVHLGERDCSAQRRHQKIVEESPTPALDDAARASLGRLAVEAARAVGYVGAGTLEFLVDAAGAHYFLEMNPRLQVEHAVTELVTGLDLVELQLRVAAGEPLPLRQEDVASRGNAIEARLYAEDPERGFLPQSGTVALWRPASGEGVRVDHALRDGVRVPPDYDPLLAKIVAWGCDREEARRRLLRAIERTVVLGVVTNKPFLVALLDSETFSASGMTTDWVEPWMRARATAPVLPPVVVPGLAALLLSGAGERPKGDGAPSGPLPWALTLDDGAAPLTVRGEPGRDATTGSDDGARGRGPAHRLTVAAETIEIELTSIGDGQITYLEDGVRRAASFARDGDAIWIEAVGAIARYEVARAGTRAAGSAADEADLRAPMAAQVVAVAVASGERVSRGDTLVTLRAMKLEHRVTAPRDGVVREVLVREGEQVAFRQVMIRLEVPADLERETPSAAAEGAAG